MFYGQASHNGNGYANASLGSRWVLFIFRVFIRAWFVLLFLALIVQRVLKGLVIVMHSNGPQAKFKAMIRMEIPASLT